MCKKVEMTRNCLEVSEPASLGLRSGAHDDGRCDYRREDVCDLPTRPPCRVGDHSRFLQEDIVGHKGGRQRFKKEKTLEQRRVCRHMSVDARLRPAQVSTHLGESSNVRSSKGHQTPHLHHLSTGLCTAVLVANIASLAISSRYGRETLQCSDFCRLPPRR